MIRTIIAATVLSFAIVTTGAAQQGPQQQAQQQRQQAAAGGQVVKNARQHAQQRFAGWQTKKRDCFKAAGLTENVHWRFISPTSQEPVEVKNSVWLDQSFDHDKIELCQD